MAGLEIKSLSSPDETRPFADKWLVADDPGVVPRAPRARAQRRFEDL
jgi:hypothetical protein